MSDPSDRLSEYLDGDDPEGVDLEGVPPAEIARHLVVAATVRLLLDEGAEGKIRSAGDSVTAVLDRQGRQRRLARFAGGLAAVAAVVVTAFVYLWQPAGLDPLITRVQDFVLAGIDREYRVSVQGTSLPMRDVELRLYARSTDRYAGLLDTEFMGRPFAISLGCDGEDSWLVLPDFGMPRPTPVFVSSRSLEELENTGAMHELMVAPLVRLESALRIHYVIANLATGYRVEATPDGADRLPMRAGDVDLTADRDHQADPALPETIRLIVDPRTGALRTVVLRFPPLPKSMGGPRPMRSVRYDFVGEPDGGEALYDHASYHGSDRPVERR